MTMDGPTERNRRAPAAGGSPGLALGFACVGHTYAHLFQPIFYIVVLALEREMALSHGHAVALIFVGSVLYGVAAPLAGWLGDRWSATGMMAVYFVGLGAAMVLTGRTETPFQIAAALTLVGLFASIYHPVGIAMVADNARALGKELGINGVFGNIGVALAAVTAGFLTDLINWRAAFIVPGAVSVAVGVGYWMFLRWAPEGHKQAKPNKAVDASPGEIKRVLMIVLVGSIFASLIFNATTVSLPKVFDDRLGDLATTTAAVGGWSFIVFVIAAVAQVLVGHMLDRYPLKPVYFLVVGLKIPALVIAAHAFGANMLVASVAVMFMVFGTIPIHDTIIGRYATPEWRGRVYAVKYLVGLGVAASAIPMVGWLYDSTGGFETMFLLLAGSAAVVTACALCMPSRRPAPQPAE